MRSVGVWSVALALLVAVPAGCGGSSSPSSAGDAPGMTERSTAAPQVTSLEVGDLRCGIATTAPATVTWATANATAVEIAVDRFTPYRRGPTGTVDAVVPCDDESHTITITPTNASGAGESRSKEVEPG